MQFAPCGCDQEIKRPEKDVRAASDVIEANRASAPVEFSGQVWTAALARGGSEWYLSAFSSLGLLCQLGSKQYQREGK